MVNPCIFKLNSYGLSDVGLVRSNNEDMLMMLKDQGFFALADGMGGHNAGEVAAKEAIYFVSASIEEFFISEEKNWNIFELSSFKRLCIENANSWIYHLGKKKKQLKGMGTTLCTLLFYDYSIIYGHVGDSRIYRLRNGVLKQLTKDHSLLNRMIAEGQAYSKKNDQYKNILTRAIGTQNEVDAEIRIEPVTPDDVYLMCTDGLTDLVDDDTIKKILIESPDLKTASMNLVQKANYKGGHDNVTVLLVKPEEQDEKNNIYR